MKKKKRVIITGGTGLLGGTAAIKMAFEWDICLWTKNYVASFPGIASKCVKLENEDDVIKALNEFKPDVLIHAAGMTNIEECETNQHRASISNVLTTKILGKCCAKASVKFVYISTDHVAQDKETSTESEVGFPVNVYAKTKLEGEFEALRSNPNTLVLRTNFFTWGNSHRKSFLDYIVDNLRSMKPITLFEDVRFNPLSGELVLKFANELIDKQANGIFNVVGDTKISKYDFGIIVADVFGLDKSIFRKGKFDDSQTLVKRPFNLTLDNSKLKNTINPLKINSIEEMLYSLKDEEKTFKEKLLTSIKSPESMNLINYGKQSIDDSDFESVIACLGSSWLTQGPKVEEFEKKVANYVGAKYAVAMCNWTAGLHMAVLAADVGPNDYVVTSPLSFVASSNCAIYAGAKPYFVDIDPSTLNIDPKLVEEACKKLKKVKAIIPVHFAGAPCDMSAMRKIADKYGAVLIEDAAHALGGSYLSGEKIGNAIYSEMIGFSFHPVKNITTGEGGMLLTNDEKIYHKLLRLRSHGITKGDDAFINIPEAFTNGVKNSWYYEMQEIGFNYRITDLQSALGISQMNKLPSFTQKRIGITKRYDLAFKEFKNLKVVQSELREFSGNHLYVGLVDFESIGMNRSELYSKFKAEGIQLHLHYIPIYRQPFYMKNYPQNLEEFPNTEAYYRQVVTFPLYASMNDEEVGRVIETARKYIG